MAKLTTQQVLDLDCRKEGSKNTIQRVLRQIKPLSKYPEEEVLPLEAIEKAIQVMDRKYNLGINYISCDTRSTKAGTIWAAHLCNASEYRFATVYGLSLYEVTAKAAIRLYSELKRRRET